MTERASLVGRRWKRVARIFLFLSISRQSRMASSEPGKRLSVRVSATWRNVARRRFARISGLSAEEGVWRKPGVPRWRDVPRYRVFEVFEMIFQSVNRKRGREILSRSVVPLNNDFCPVVVVREIFHTWYCSVIYADRIQFLIESIVYICIIVARVAINTACRLNPLLSIGKSVYTRGILTTVRIKVYRRLTKIGAIAFNLFHFSAV